MEQSVRVLQASLTPLQVPFPPSLNMIWQVVRMRAKRQTTTLSKRKKITKVHFNISTRVPSVSPLPQLATLTSSTLRPLTRPPVRLPTASLLFYLNGSPKRWILSSTTNLRGSSGSTAVRHPVPPCMTCLLAGLVQL